MLGNFGGGGRFEGTAATVAQMARHVVSQAVAPCFEILNVVIAEEEYYPLAQVFLEIDEKTACGCGAGAVFEGEVRVEVVTEKNEEIGLRSLCKNTLHPCDVLMDVGDDDDVFGVIYHFQCERIPTHACQFASFRGGVAENR